MPDPGVSEQDARHGGVFVHIETSNSAFTQPAISGAILRANCRAARSSSWPASPPQPAAAHAEPYLFFNADEAAFIEGAVERLIPAYDNGLQGHTCQGRRSGTVRDALAGNRRPINCKLPPFGKDTPMGRPGQPTEHAGIYMPLASQDELMSQ